VRRHPILGRLPFLLLAVVGVWLWRGPDSPRERAVFLRLEGPAAVAVRSLEVQATTADGEVLQRTQRFFAGPPPPEVQVELRLPEGRHPLLVFLADGAGRALPLLREELEVTEAESYAVRLKVAGPATPAPGR
jgi:hypothetical protein